jgi:hypothetical protein
MEDEKISDSNYKLEGTVNMLIEMRKQARDNKNFALSDQIRDQLIALEFSSKTVKKELLLVFKFQLLHEPIVKNKSDVLHNYSKYVIKIIVYPFLVLVGFIKLQFPLYTCSL